MKIEKKKYLFRRNILLTIVFLLMLLINISIMPGLGINSQSSLKINDNHKSNAEYLDLPPPGRIDMSLEWTMHHRMSVRSYTTELVSDEDLSTILWHAYGITNDGKRTVHLYGDQPAVKIYVINKEGIYSYDVINHSIVMYKEGNYLWRVGIQRRAPLLLGLVWDSNKYNDEYLSSAEIGAVGQNVYFAICALNLGTVTTGTYPDPLEGIGLPEGEVGRMIMYIGHPNFDYDFKYRPLWISLLPRIQDSSMSLTDSIEERNETISYEEDITRQEMSQLLWASYGYSYYIDRTENDLGIARHRTLPSGCGTYPLFIYFATEEGIYRYYPDITEMIHGPFNQLKNWPQITFIKKEINGDHRNEIAQASKSFVASAPFVIISILDLNQMNETPWTIHEYFIPWAFYYEAGASAHNVLLESTAWGLSGNIAEISDNQKICDLLNIDSERFIPLLTVTVGRNN